MTAAENSMDPSHAPYLHNKVVVDKKEAAPMPMNIVAQPTLQGFKARPLKVRVRLI